ncbi:MAG TPA: LptE family protein [Vicinamibacterales bacterium]|nr:LptE family protein [Vicinamibacterales bacterium]
MFTRFGGFTVIAILVSMSVGCGYALAGRGSFLPDYIKRVGIPTFENRSNVPDVGQVLTRKVRDEFIGRGKYEVTNETAGSDAVLTGEVLGITLQPIGLDSQTQLASRYLFTLTVKVSFTDSKTSQVLWSNDALIFREEYELGARASSVTAGPAFFDQERSLLDRLGGDAARSVVTSILEAF